jgi:MFS transporter, SP family, sugar:H+ symporter
MLNSLPLLGYGVGVFGAGFLGEALGRRTVYVAVLCICLVGIGVSYSSKTFGQILAGRIIVQTAVGMEGWLVPLYNAETVPAQVRGTMYFFPVSILNIFRFGHCNI